MEKQSLLYFLSQIKDTRKDKGKRYPLPSLLCMLIIAQLNGCKAIKSAARFLKQHEDLFTDLFGLEHGVMACSQINTVLKGLDFDSVNRAIWAWTTLHHPLDAVVALSGDGKALRSTVTDSQNNKQNYMSLVSFVDQASGLAYVCAKVEQKKKNEAEEIRKMILEFGITSTIIRLDSLHSQKKNIEIAEETNNILFCQIKKTALYYINY